MRKFCLILLLALALLIPAALAETTEFTFDAQEGAITGYSGPGGDVVVPGEIDGVRVWDILNSPFLDNETVTGLTLPDGPDVLNDNVTSQLPNLTGLILPDSLRGICRGNLQLCDSPTDIEAIVADYAANPAETPEPVEAKPVDEAGAPYVGDWQLTQLTEDGDTFNAADFGMSMVLTLNADGTYAMLDVEGDAQSGAWAPTGDSAALDGISLSLTEDGRLMAEEDGMQMYFERADGEAGAPGISEPAPEIGEPGPEPDAPAIVSVDNESDYIGVKLSCVAAEASGYSLDPAQLGGEYAITFNADGTAAFVVANSELPGLTWVQDGGDRVIDYYGQGELRFIPNGSGYTLDYMGMMLLTFAA